MAIDHLASWVTVGVNSLTAGGIYNAGRVIDNRFDGSKAKRSTKPKPFLNLTVREELVNFLTTNVRELKAPDAAQIVRLLFLQIFGTRQASWKCLHRSVSVTVITLLVVGTTISQHFHLLSLVSRAFQDKSTALRDSITIIFVVICCSIIPDYLSLWKGRAILSYLQRAGFIGRMALIAADILISLLISVFFIALFFSIGALFLPFFGGWPEATSLQVAPPTFAQNSMDGIWRSATSYASDALMLPIKYFVRPFDPDGTANPEGTAGEIVLLSIMFSTLFTSFWTILVGTSSTFLRIVISGGYFLRFTQRIFNVKDRPFESLGIVVAGVYWLLAAIYTFVARISF